MLTAAQQRPRSRIFPPFRRLNSGRAARAKRSPVRPKLGYRIRHIGSHYAGDQGRVVHDSDADYLHGKDGAAMGVPNRAEKAALIPHIIMTRLSFSSIRSDLSNEVSDASAQLQGGSLASGGTAEQMGQNRSRENQGSCLKGDLPSA